MYIYIYIYISTDMKLHGGAQVPICMRQYERVFCTTRIPGRDTDITVHGDSRYHPYIYI